MHSPKLGGVDRYEALRFIGKTLETTISRAADRWFLSVTVEIPDPRVCRKNQAVCGGIWVLATLSNGEKIGGPKAYAAALKKLRQLSQQLSRQIEAASWNTKRATWEEGHCRGSLVSE